jgi:hypothetical protein
MFHVVTFDLQVWDQNLFPKSKLFVCWGQKKDIEKKQFTYEEEYMNL